MQIGGTDCSPAGRRSSSSKTDHAVGLCPSGLKTSEEIISYVAADRKGLSIACERKQLLCLCGCKGQSSPGFVLDKYF